MYDADGNRVQSTINGTTTTFVGNYYEVSGSTVTKYYLAGGSRVAMNVNGTVSYLLSDQLGSTSITTNSSGVKTAELRYKPWGEVRFTSGTTPTKYTYTGQYSNMGDFGLMFYNARFYDPYLGRFSSADSIVPGGVQGYDRYAYANNNPSRYTDPSGHNYCDMRNGHNDEDCDAGEDRISKSDNLQRLRKEHEKQSPTIGANSDIGTRILAANSVELGDPIALGDYLGGLNGPSGEPNSFFVAGAIVDLEGDRPVSYPVAAGLKYNAYYDLNFYEHGTVISLTENYELHSNTPWTDIKNAGAVLNLKDTHGTQYQSFLGEMSEGPAAQRTTSIVLFGGAPASMSIKIRVLLNNTWVGSAPLPQFRFGAIP